MSWHKVCISGSSHYDVKVDLCLSFCSVCNNFIGPVLPFRSYIWHWYWLHRYIVSSICHEFDNISLMISESIMHSASMVDDALDCILGVPFFHCWTKVMFWSMYCIFQHSIALCFGFLLNLLCFIARMCYSHKEFDCCSSYCSSICLIPELTIGWLPFLTQHWMVWWLPQMVHFASSIPDSLIVLCISTSLLLGNLACQVLW
jgi:hypothetical protein